MAFNLFANDKQKNYPGYQQQQQQGSYGQADFATDKAANYPSAMPQQQAQPQTVAQPQPVVQQQQQKQTAKPQPAVDPTSPTSGMDAVIANMYTSPEQEEKMRKASVANQRILAIGDALRHIGNIYNTVNGAPSMQFNKPWEEEQTRYERGKAVRDAANARYYSYQQAKAVQDAKQRQWEHQFRYNAAKDARDYELRKKEAEARNNLREAQLNRYQTLIELDNARKEGIINDNEYKRLRAKLYPGEVQSRINKNNRTGGNRSTSGKGMDEYTTTTETTYNYDNSGNRTGSTTTKRRTVNGKAQPTQTKKKKALPGQTPSKSTSGKKKLPGT